MTTTTPIVVAQDPITVQQKYTQLFSLLLSLLFFKDDSGFLFESIYLLQTGNLVKEIKIKKRFSIIYDEKYIFQRLVSVKI